VKYVLDTHVWLWSVFDDPRLSRRARAVLTGVMARERVGIAAISVKEAAWHLAHGRIDVEDDAGPWPLWLRNAAALPELEILPLSVDVAIESDHLGDGFPPDPADRLIAATARVHGLTLITADRHIRKSGAVRTLW
jgi:PIN domain nuclease of toxin-antitoxin system